MAIVHKHISVQDAETCHVLQGVHAEQPAIVQEGQFSIAHMEGQDGLLCTQHDMPDAAVCLSEVSGKKSRPCCMYTLGR